MPITVDKTHYPDAYTQTDASTQTEKVANAASETLPLSVSTCSITNYVGTSPFADKIKEFMDLNGYASKVTADDTFRFANAVIRIALGENWMDVASSLRIENKSYKKRLVKFIIEPALNDIANGASWKQTANKYNLTEEKYQDLLKEYAAREARNRLEENDFKNWREIAKSFHIPEDEFKDDVIVAAKECIISRNPRRMSCPPCDFGWERPSPRLMTEESDDLEKPVPVSWQEVAEKYQLDVESLKYSVLSDVTTFLDPLEAEKRNKQHWADEDEKRLKDILTAFHYEESATELLRLTITTEILEKSVTPVLKAGFAKDQLITAFVQVAKVLKNHKHARYLESFIQKHQKLSEEGFDLRKLIAEHETTTNIDKITKREKESIYSYGQFLDC